MTQLHSHQSDDLGYISGDRCLYNGKNLNRSYPSHLSTGSACPSDVYRGLSDNVLNGGVTGVLYDTTADKYTSSGVVSHTAVLESSKQTQCSLKLSRANSAEAELELNNIGKPGVVGIKNHGNTCFASSVIQCLSNTERFTEHFINDHHRGQLVAAKQSGRECAVTDGLARLIESLWTQAYTSDLSRDLIRIVRESTELFADANGHDAEEFLLWLLNTVNDELYGSTKQDDAKQVIHKCVYTLLQGLYSLVIHIFRLPSSFNFIWEGEYT